MSMITVKSRCPGCGQYSSVQVDEVDYKDFKEGEKSAEEAFPYLNDMQLASITIGCCPECYLKDDIPTIDPEEWPDDLPWPFQDR